MPLVEGKLIHDQAAHIVSDKFAVLTLQALVVYGLDGVPVQAGELCHVGNRQELGQGFDPDSNSVGNAASPVQPGDVFHDPSAAVVAVHSPDRDIQPDATVEAVALPHSAATAFMHQHAGRSAGAAPRSHVGRFGEFD